MRSTSLLLAAIASALAPATIARAQVACAPGSFTAATSTFQVDANHNGAWDGDAGGDRTTQIGAYLGPGEPIVGDWNGDGFDDVGVVVGDTFVLDLDGDGVWEGNAGGDRAASFAASFGPGAAIVGDWDGDGRDQIGVFLSEEVRFLLDANGNGVWDGTGGGDENVVLAKWYGISAGRIPLVADWNGDGSDDVAWGEHSLLVIDLNGDRQWDGNAGGDRGGRSPIPLSNADDVFAANFVPGQGARIGTWLPTTSWTRIDLNGNFLWNRAPGGDVDASYAAFAGIGVPVVCDWNGDGAAEIAKVVGGKRYQIDLDRNFKWLGTTAGDLVQEFDIGTDAAPIGARWLTP